MIRSKPSNLFFSMLVIGFGCLFLTVDYAAAAPQYIIKFATVAPEGSTWIKHLKNLDKNLRLKNELPIDIEPKAVIAVHWFGLETNLTPFKEYYPICLSLP